MNTSSWLQRLAVCSWSLQPQSPQQLIEQLKSLDLPRVQIALDPIRTQPSTWRSCGELCARHGIEMVSGMMGEQVEGFRWAGSKAMSIPDNF